MFLLADFGNKENKAKRKSAENRIGYDRVMSELDSYGADPAYLAKEKAKEIRTIRERRNLPLVDPLAYRAKQKGKQKILAPYTAKEGLYKLPSWEESSGRIQDRGSRGSDYVGSDSRLSSNTKRQNRVDEILKPKPKTTVTVQKSPAPVSMPRPKAKVPDVKLDLPQVKFDTSKVKTVTDTASKAAKPKGKGGLGLGLALGAGALGIAGIGLALTNRKKKEVKNNA